MKDEEIPPRLKENMEWMKERQEERIKEMKQEGLDTSMLEEYQGQIEADFAIVMKVMQRPRSRQVLMRSLKLGDTVGIYIQNLSKCGFRNDFLKTARVLSYEKT